MGRPKKNADITPKKKTIEVQGDYVLKGDVKCKNLVTIKKGQKFDRKVNPVIVRKLLAKKSEAIKQTGEVFEALEDIVINDGKIIPKGTPLSKTKDKELIEALLDEKKGNPRVLGVEVKKQVVTVETKDTTEQSEEDDTDEV